MFVPGMLSRRGLVELLQEVTSARGLPDSNLWSTYSMAGLRSVSVDAMIPTSYAPSIARATKSIASATSMPFSSARALGQFEG